ncbi:hypothetical protein K1719_046284 [Acacia pycnantha]|nr:hypothetical protein K1719_046284 [Acacia pycnantha]
MPPSSSSLPLLHQSPHPPYDFPFPLFHQATCSLPETPPHSSTQPQSVEQNSLVPPTDFTQTPEATPSPPPEGQAGPSGTSSRVRKKCKETAIESPYPWAKPTRAKIFSREELLSRNITVIIGDVRCKGCKEKYKVEYDLLTKFSEISSFIDKKKDLMHSRAPKEWCNPELLDCKLCNHSKCVEPILTKKKSTNWLFLFLGQMIGFCKLNHLRYYCKYANLHKTGAKNRLVFYTYMDLRRQLLHSSA